MDEDDTAWVSLTVTKNPASAIVTIKDAAGNTVAETNGSYKLLKDGAYTYTATTTEEGYEDAAGSVDLAAGTLAIELPKVESLEVTTPATKLTYFQNEKLKTDGRSDGSLYARRRQGDSCGGLCGQGRDGGV